MTMLVDGQGISVMVFSTDEITNKAVVCAGVPEKSDKAKQLEVSEWLTAALEPLKGRCGKGKGGLASGQVSGFHMFYTPIAITRQFDFYCCENIVFWFNWTEEKNCG